MLTPATIAIISTASVLTSLILITCLYCFKLKVLCEVSLMLETLLIFAVFLHNYYLFLFSRFTIFEAKAACDSKFILTCKRGILRQSD